MSSNEIHVPEDRPPTDATEYLVIIIIIIIIITIIAVILLSSLYGK